MKLCRVEGCPEPAAQNSADCSTHHGRRRRYGDPLIEPEPHPKRQRKLAPNDVREMKVLLAEGATGREMALRFGVSEAQISRIRKGHQWEDVEP